MLVKRSPLWYELPLLFSIIGGIVAYFKIRKDDPVKSRRCIIIGVVYTIPIIFVIILIIVVGSGTIFVIASESMVPELEVNDVVRINESIPFEEINIGDIIVFNRPSDHDRTIIHRVIMILGDDPKIIKTKGDANRASISGTDFPITKEEYIGRVDYVIPQLGSIPKLLGPPVNYIISMISCGIIILPIILHVKYNKEKQNSPLNDEN